MRIKADDTIALVIDYQERLVPVISNMEGLLRNTIILLKGLRILNIPMIITQQYTKGLGNTIPVITDAVGRMQAYFDKITFSCADDPEIMREIEKHGKKNIIICGIEAHICVLQTVIDLLEKGYNVILVENCVGSRKKSDRNFALTRAIKEGAVIATYESILFELARVAGTDVFKKISSLIK